MTIDQIAFCAGTGFMSGCCTAVSVSRVAFLSPLGLMMLQQSSGPGSTDMLKSQDCHKAYRAAVLSSLISLQLKAMGLGMAKVGKAHSSLAAFSARHLR